MGKTTQVLYVATNGKDTWPGTRERPLKTLEGARDRLRLTPAPERTAPVEVVVRGGVYRLQRTLELTPQDSATVASPVTYRAHPGESVTITGGRRVVGWSERKASGRRMLVSDLKLPRSETLRELFVNGERRLRSRYPKKGFHSLRNRQGVDLGRGLRGGTDQLPFRGRQLQRWRNFADIEVVILSYWLDWRTRLVSVDWQRRVARLEHPTYYGLKVESGAEDRFYLDNVWEEIAPGEFYHDRQKARLYYCPHRHETLAGLQVVRPYLTKLLAIRGEPAAGTFVRHLGFEGFEFRHARITDRETVKGKQSAAHIAGAVCLRGAHNCTVRDCEFTQIGRYGVELQDGCYGNQICANRFHDLGAGGIKADGSQAWRAAPEYTMNNVYQNNHIHDAAKIAHRAAGILLGHSGGNTIAHNHIHHLYYSGISVGWIWGYGRSVSRDNLIEYNHIHDIGQGWLNDMGGIYCLGSQGTCIRRNLIHDVECYRYGGNGIYLDEGVVDAVVEENVVYRAATGGFFLHYGRDNLIRNNVLGPSAGVHLRRIKEEEHVSFRMLNNIFYLEEGDLLFGRWCQPGYLFNRNLYWRADRKALRFLDWTFAAWQDRGQDVDSIVANPLFVDPQNGDFRLQPQSPAWTLGFKPIDLRQVGIIEGPMDRVHLSSDHEGYGHPHPPPEQALPR